MQCIGKLFTLIEESCTNNIVKLSDFNATLNSVFEGELLEMCSTLIIIIIIIIWFDHRYLKQCVQSKVVYRDVTYRKWVNIIHNC